VIERANPARFKQFLVDAQAQAERRYSVYQQLAGITVPFNEAKDDGATPDSSSGEEGK
jgi:hypothetical protein